MTIQKKASGVQRHPIAWQTEEFADPIALDKEMRRVFDVCHTCRRCYNLCDTFPRLFDLIDGSSSGELDTVESKDFKSVVDACTLCDICYVASCPYVPPHEWNIDFPHLMLRYRTMELEQKKASFVQSQLVQTDRNGKLGCQFSEVANWAVNTNNRPVRFLMEKTLDIDREVKLPQFHSATFKKQFEKNPVPINGSAPAYGNKVVLFATCFVNYHQPEIGVAAQAVLAKNGIQMEIVYPQCCGMPLFEQGNLAEVSKHARTISEALLPWIDQGYEVITLVPSCALMMKSEWPLLLPDDPLIQKIAEHTWDISEYFVQLNKTYGLAEGMKPLSGDVTLHVACHSRAQNIGYKAQELLRLVPDAKVEVVARCSGHGGTWGVMKNNFPIALKIGAPTVRQIEEKQTRYLVSECPLAALHLQQEFSEEVSVKFQYKTVQHPIQLFASAYGHSLGESFDESP